MRPASASDLMVAHIRIARLLETGAPEAFDALLEQYGSEIQTVAYLIVRDRLDAEDILAETLITAWQKGRDLREPAALRTWLLRIATNKALLLRRSRSRIVPITEAAELTGPDSTDPSATRLAILAAVGELPTEMRAAVVLRYYADLPVEEVARVLGKSPNTVKSQLRVALARMRTSFDSRTGQEGRRDVV